MTGGSASEDKEVGAGGTGEVGGRAKPEISAASNPESDPEPRQQASLRTLKGERKSLKE